MNEVSSHRPESPPVDLESLNHALHSGEGAGVRVAILDTGIDPGHPALEGKVRTCFEVTGSGRGLECQQVEGSDPVGHGTACAGILHEVAPQAEISSIRVMGKTALGTGEHFLYGLHWAIEVGEFEVINLSLGILQQRFHLALREMVDRAYRRGVLLVAAAHNRGLVSYPAHFASLVAVESGDFEDPSRFDFLADHPVEIRAHGVAVRAPSPGGKFQVWTGTSFACPRISGLGARLKSVLPGMTPFEFKTYLKVLGNKSHQD